MKKNLYRCEACKAQIIAQAPDGFVTPFFLKCRAPGCDDMAKSTMFSFTQDVLADAHVEFTYEGAKEGYGPMGSKDLRPVPVYVGSWP